jgi:hypothetical protein
LAVFGRISRRFDFVSFQSAPSWPKVAGFGRVWPDYAKERFHFYFLIRPLRDKMLTRFFSE